MNDQNKKLFASYYSITTGMPLNYVVENIDRFISENKKDSHFLTAVYCFELSVLQYISDLKESLTICEQENLHGHAHGIIGGSLAVYNSVLKEIKTFLR